MRYIIVTDENIESAVEIRLEMLKVVNELSSDYVFDEEFMTASKEYFEKGKQTTVLAVDDKVIGCATICYIEMMPTFSHPTGKRAHLMNVYTNSAYRRQGIAYHMLCMLIQEAKERGVTEISLDATALGKPLYEKLGFKVSEECMTLTF